VIPSPNLRQSPFSTPIHTQCRMESKSKSRRLAQIAIARVVRRRVQRCRCHLEKQPERSVLIHRPTCWRASRFFEGQSGQSPVAAGISVFQTLVRDLAPDRPPGPAP